MHPEVEGEIREGARQYLAVEAESRGSYTALAERGVLSFDDIYFLGVTQAAERVAYETLLDKQMIMSEDTYSDEPSRNSIIQETSRLVAELYHCSPSDAVMRWRCIQRRFSEAVVAKILR